MKKKSLIFIIFLIFFGWACTNNCNEANDDANQTDEIIISKPELKLESDVITPEVLWSFGRVG